MVELAIEEGVVFTAAPLPWIFVLFSEKSALGAAGRGGGGALRLRFVSGVDVLMLPSNSGESSDFEEQTLSSGEEAYIISLLFKGLKGSSLSASFDTLPVWFMRGVTDLEDRNGCGRTGGLFVLEC